MPSIIENLIGAPIAHMTFRNHETGDFHHAPMIYVASNIQNGPNGKAGVLVPCDRKAVAQCITLWKNLPLDDYFQGSSRTVVDMLRAGW